MDSSSALTQTPAAHSHDCRNTWLLLRAHTERCAVCCTEWRCVQDNMLYSEEENK